jgi:hypothetical protein
MIAHRSHVAVLERTDYCPHERRVVQRGLRNASGRLVRNLAESRGSASQLGDSAKMRASATRRFGDSVIPSDQRVSVRRSDSDRTGPGRARRRRYAAQVTRASPASSSSQEGERGRGRRERGTLRERGREKRGVGGWKRATQRATQAKHSHPPREQHRLRERHRLSILILPESNTG